jgi:hypothetical protein
MTLFSVWLDDTKSDVSKIMDVSLDVVGSLISLCSVDAGCVRELL